MPYASTYAEPLALYPTYKRERARLLSNQLCDRKLERRGFDIRPKGCRELASVIGKRELAEFRARWAAVRMAVR